MLNNNSLLDFSLHKPGLIFPFIPSRRAEEPGGLSELLKLTEKRHLLSHTYFTQFSTFSFSKRLNSFSLLVTSVHPEDNVHLLSTCISAHQPDRD